MATKVIHIKDAPPDWRKNPEYVYCGRPSKWGNPFPMRTEADRAQVCKDFAAWFSGQKHLLDSLHEVRGKVLICFCAPRQCHCHEIQRYADAVK